jgi:hypothetical protein
MPDLLLQTVNYFPEGHEQFFTKHPLIASVDTLFNDTNTMWENKYLYTKTMQPTVVNMYNMNRLAT